MQIELFLSPARLPRLILFLHRAGSILFIEETFMAWLDLTVKPFWRTPLPTSLVLTYGRDARVSRSRIRRNDCGHSMHTHSTLTHLFPGDFSRVSRSAAILRDPFGAALTYTLVIGMSVFILISRYIARASILCSRRMRLM